MPNDTSSDTKTHIITRDLANYRETDRCCPICNDGTRIVKRLKVLKNDEGNINGFGGHYWVCANHDDNWDHYNYSPGGGKNKPRETNGATVPRQFLPPEPPKPSMRVVKRDRATGTITPLVVS